MLCNAMTETFDVLEIFGKKVLFTCMRIDRKTVPNGLYVYDVRHDDDCSGEICEIKSYILVNHWGTIITDTPIKLDELWNCRLVEKEDYHYTGDSFHLKEFFDIK